MGQPAFKVVWEPQPGPQMALVACPVFEVFYGGARGGGKTDGSLGDWLEHSGKYGADAVGVFFRRKFKQLSEVIARSKQLFKPLGARYNEQKAEWTMPNGARLLFRYLERDSDAEEYQGHNYTRVYIEEVTNFPNPDPINKLRATLRSAAGVPVGMRLTGNPGGPGHNWVKKRYIDPSRGGYTVISEEEDIELDGKTIRVSIDRIFIPSRLGDNVLLMRNDPTYVLRLKQSGSAALVKAWLEGNWDIVDGAFFDEWDSERHVLGQEWIYCIPERVTRFRAFDWGSAKPFSVGWYVLSDGSWGLPYGAMLKYREWYGASGPNKGIKMPADLVAKGILERERGEVMQYGAADPSIFIQNGGPSIAEMMAVKGCHWRRGDNRREPGWEQMHMRLQGNAESKGEPMLYFLESCVDSIRTIPTLQHDQKNEEDLDTEGEDHAADETRYAVMSRPWISKVSSRQAPMPKLPHQMTINELVARQTKRRLARNG